MVAANSLNISETGFQSFDGVSVFKGRTLTAGSGISILNGNGVSGNPIISATSGGSGDVSGPGTSTDRAIPTWNGVTGDLLRDNPTSTIDSSGYYTNTSQPAFYAYLANNVAGQTGNGTYVKYPFDTITYQQGGANFNTGTSTYTLPKSGVWTFGFVPFIYNVDGTNGVFIAVMNINGTRYRLYELNAANLHSSGEVIVNGSHTAYYASGTPVYCEVVVSGAGLNVGLAGGAQLNGFSAVLLT